MSHPLKNILAAALAALLCFSMTACSLLPGQSAPEPESSESEAASLPEPEPVDPNWPVTIGDVTVEAKPEAVICLSPELTEHIGDLGLIGRLAAVSDYCDWPKETEGIAKAGTAQSPNYEVIDGAAPQYIILQGQLSEADLVEMQQRNITVVSFPSVSSTEELFSLLRLLALFFEGNEASVPVAEALFDEYNEAIDGIVGPIKTHRSSSGAEYPKGAYVRVLDRTMATGGTLEGELLQTYIFENAAASYSDWEYPDDQWASFAAQVLFVNTDVVIKDLEQNEKYKSLNAVYNDAVYQINMDVFARGGLRAMEILRTMAVSVWPAAFPDEAPLSPAYPSLYKEA